jgi:hypothetical protein
MEKGWREIGRVAVMYKSGKEEVPKLPGGVFTGGEKKRSYEDGTSEFFSFPNLPKYELSQLQAFTDS